jgi:phage terminase Nu1 subunit (DNA packaging protein)
LQVNNNACFDAGLSLLSFLFGVFGNLMIKDKDVKIIDGNLCLTSTALYTFLGIDESTLVRWGKKGCPKVSRGWWNLKSVLEWRGVLNTDGDVEDQGPGQQKMHFEAKLKEAQVEAIQLKNDIAKGEYIPKEDIVSELQRYFISLKHSMLGYSRKIAIELSAYVDSVQARRIEKDINELTKNALMQLSINGVYDAKEFKIKKRKSEKE